MHGHGRIPAHRVLRDAEHVRLRAEADHGPAGTAQTVTGRRSEPPADVRHVPDESSQPQHDPSVCAADGRALTGFVECHPAISERGRPCTVSRFRLTSALRVVRSGSRSGVNSEARRSPMLELRPNCECCDRDLAPDEGGAWICSFECTFCGDCATDRLHCACPNCGGELVPRPRRPSAKLGRSPGSNVRVVRSGGCPEAPGDRLRSVLGSDPDR